MGPGRRTGCSALKPDDRRPEHVHRLTREEGARLRETVA
jgi:hypothetical protein